MLVIIYNTFEKLGKIAAKVFNRTTPKEDNYAPKLRKKRGKKLGQRNCTWRRNTKYHKQDHFLGFNHSVLKCASRAAISLSTPQNFSMTVGQIS